MTNTFTFLAQAAGGGLQMMIMPILLVIMFWVLAIRPQQKRAKELKARQSALKKGDNVVTIGGMHASVNSVNEGTVSLRLSEGVFVKYDKSAIARVITKDSAKSAKVEK